MLSKITKVRVAVTNDANAAALGEATFWAGKEYKDMYRKTERKMHLD